MKRTFLVGSIALTLAACSQGSAPGTPFGSETEVGSVAQTSKLGEVSQAPVMYVDGKTLVDSSGKPVVIRGIEGWFGTRSQESPENMRTLVDAIASQGFNAVRLQLLTDDLTKIEALIQYAHSKGMVFYLNDDHMPGLDQEQLGGFLGRQEVQDMVERHRHNLIIDVTIEEPEDAEDAGAVAAWVQAQKAAISQVRGWGYTQPLIIGTLNHGRFLRGFIDHGAEIVQADPLGSIILNCQMYWGQYSSGFSYQSLSGYSEGDEGIREAAREVSAQPVLIQWGIDAVDDGGNHAKVPYELLMVEAETYGIGTLFWQWRDPGNDNDQNSLVLDQFDTSTLTELGDVVINTNSASIRKTSRLVEDHPSGVIVTPPDSPNSSVCADVPTQYVSDGDGCDCPANGDTSCDPDCAQANAGDQYCGCDYCYPEALQPSVPDAPTSVPDEATTTPDAPTSVPDEATTAPDTPTSVPDEATTTPDAPTSVPDEATTAPDAPTSVPDEATTAPDAPTSVPDEATTTPDAPTSVPDEATTAPDAPTSVPDELTTTPDAPDTEDSTSDQDTNPAADECAEVPSDYLSAGDGCDCPANGDTSCDPDCADGNPGGAYCGCEYCYPE